MGQLHLELRWDISLATMNIMREIDIAFLGQMPKQPPLSLPVTAQREKIPMLVSCLIHVYLVHCLP